MAEPPPYEAPPPYDAICGSYCYVPTKAQSQLCVVDFLPEEPEVRFPTLIGRSNEWLRLNPEWEARACESIEFKSKGGVPSVQNVTFTEHNTGTTYVRGLRLWLVPRRDTHLGPQQLAYFDTIPKQTPGFLTVQFERFDSVMAQLNNRISQNPLNGLIITVETQPMKYSTTQGAIDPDRSYFTDFGFSVFVIRVFYEIGPPAYESVGVIDFFPKSRDGVYDTIPNLVNLASQWTVHQPNIRISNVQTVGMKMKYDQQNRVDDTKMAIKEVRSDKHKTCYLRILRLFYVRTPETIVAVTYMSPFQGPLTCKTFLPIQLTSGNFSKAEFETAQQMLTRISEWVATYNVRILSAETIPVRMYSGGAKYGPEATYFYNKSGNQERFVVTVRLYLDGSYPDPHISMCPIAYRGWTSEPVTDSSNIPSAPAECSIA